MRRIIGETDAEAIFGYFGKEFFEKALHYLQMYSEKWGLADFRFLRHFSINCIFLCQSEQYGDAVMKISANTGGEFERECHVLREYEGRKFCGILACDAENNVALIERMTPGTQLKEEPLLGDRLAAFASLYEGLHIEPANPALYVKYEEKLKDYAAHMVKSGDLRELSYHISKAMEICASISAVYGREMLLHGDLHSGNILKRGDCEYAAIDPQGLVGDPVFDIARFIMVENRQNADMLIGKRMNRVNRIIEYLEGKLHIPEDIVRQCFYVETVAFESWGASVGEVHMDRVSFAEAVMKCR